MPDTGWVTPGTGTNVDTGATQWVNPDRITADDGSNATNNSVSGETGDTLKASNFGFGLATGLTILGVEVRIQANDATTSSTIDTVNIGTSDGSLGTPKTPHTVLTATMTDYFFGDGSDLWGLALTPADVNLATFQARWFPVSTGTHSTACDVMFMRITYSGSTPAAVPIGQQSHVLMGNQMRGY